MISYLIVIIILSASSVFGGEQISLINGDFEKTESPLVGWQIQGKVDEQVSSGFWRTCTVKFNSGSHSKVTLYIGAYGTPTGRCWIDNLRPTGFTILNPNFEELTADRKAFTAWGADQPGKLTHVSTDRSANGRRSAIFVDASYAAQQIRIFQAVDVVPNHEYSYTFDFYMEDDFYGGIRCPVVAADTSEYVYLGGMVPAEGLDELIADRSFAGSRQCRIHCSGDTASVFQDADVPQDAVLEAAVQLKPKNFDGEVTLSVEDIETNKIVATIANQAAAKDWKPLQLRFVNSSSKLRIRVAATGKGEVLIDGVRLSTPQLLPIPQEVTWEKALTAFKLEKELTYSVAGESGELLETGIAMLTKELSAIGIQLSRKQSGGEILIATNSTDTSKVPKKKGDEAYFLGVTQNGVRIESHTERGAFYGIMTLLQLLSKDEENGRFIIGCTITDWPDFPWRGIFQAQSAEWMARRKFNRAEHPDISKYEEYLKHGIIAIPHENIVHYPYENSTLPDLLQDPNYSEGVGRKEEIKLVEETPVELSGKNVLRTKLTNIKVRSANRKTLYAEDRDYRVIPGELKMLHTIQVKRDSKPFAIARIPGSRIPNGAAVLVEYEHVAESMDTGGMLCLAEEDPQRLVAQKISAEVAKYKLPYFGAHASESFASIGKGPRCKQTGLTPSQLLARYYKTIDQAAKRANPECRLFAWSDDFLPWQHAPRTGLADIVSLLPSDAIMGSWFYEPSSTVKFNIKTAKLWTKFRHDFTLMGWYDYVNIRGTAAVALWARENGMPCLGTSSWAYPTSTGSLEFLDEVARCAWRGPRKGEAGYVDVQSYVK